MKILLTGAFGNVGEHTVLELANQGYSFRCFDKKIRRTKKIYKLVKNKADFEVIWGDIRNKEIVKEIVKDIDYIIHLAAIIPPEADKKRKYAYQVNVEGTRNLVQAAEKQEKKPKFIFTSSIAIYGSRMTLPPPRKVTEEPKPIDHDEYAKHKVEMEKLLQSSKLEWTILRLAAVPSLRMPIKIPRLMYDVPFDQRLEMIDPRDVALACVNAIKADVFGKIYNIAGGEKCQMKAGDYITNHLTSFGVGPIDSLVFRIAKNDEDWFHTDFMYTEDSQQLLNYQRYSADDFNEEFRSRIKLERSLIKLVSPIARAFLKIYSPYYFKNKRNKKTSKDLLEP